jgi:hypothetical protein
VLQDFNHISPVWEQVLGLNRMQHLRSVHFQSLRREEVEPLITPDWLSGFVEANGSFYLVTKGRHSGRICHGFGITPLLRYVLRRFVPQPSPPFGFVPQPSSLKKVYTSFPKDPGGACLENKVPNPELGASAAKSGFLLLQAIRVRLRIKSLLRRQRTLSQNKQWRTSLYWSLDTTNHRTIKTICKMLSGKIKGMKAVEFRIWQRALNYRGNNVKLAKIHEQMQRLRSVRVSPQGY